MLSGTVNYICQVAEGFAAGKKPNSLLNNPQKARRVLQGVTLFNLTVEVSNAAGGGGFESCEIYSQRSTTGHAWVVSLVGSR